MPRTLTGDTLTALTSRVLHCEYIFEGLFTSYNLRLWSGVGDLSWDSKTWKGDGRFYGCSTIRDSVDVVANGISIDLPGLSTEVLSLALTESKQSCTGKLWLAFFDATEALLDSDLRFSGYLDTVDIAENANSSIVTLNYESRLIRFKNAREIRLSNEAQQSEYPGDKGFEYVTYLQGQRIYWGRPDPGRVRI